MAGLGNTSRGAVNTKGPEYPVHTQSPKALHKALGAFMLVEPREFYVAFLGERCMEAGCARAHRHVWEPGTCMSTMSTTCMHY